MLMVPVVVVAIVVGLVCERTVPHFPGAITLKN